MGKLPVEEKKQIGKLLNDAKEKLEREIEAKQQQFEEAALRARLDAEWLDLTLPAPGPRRGHLHPITRIQRMLVLFRSRLVSPCWTDRKWKPNFTISMR